MPPDKLAVPVTWSTETPAGNPLHCQFTLGILNPLTAFMVKVKAGVCPPVSTRQDGVALRLMSPMLKKSVLGCRPMAGTGLDGVTVTLAGPVVTFPPASMVAAKSTGSGVA